MPILWKNLLYQYFRVLILVLVAFIAVLITSRLDEMAHFASLGPETYYLILFVLYQIPYILPIAIPISCLISSILLFQGLSSTHELTAMRACGLSIKTIAAPLFMASLGLAMINFFIVSELATYSHLQTNLLKTELRSINPLLLLNQKHLMRLKGIYFDTMGYSKVGEEASEVVISLPNPDKNRLHLVVANKLESSPNLFQGNDLTLISSIPSAQGPEKDHFFLENIGSLGSTIEGFSSFLQKKVWTVNNDQLRLGLLWARLQEMKKQKILPETDQKQLSRSINSLYSEVSRRISLSLAVITFTLMGIAFGISIQRTRSAKGVIVVMSLASLYIVSFFIAKGQDEVLPTTLILYYLPHIIIIGSSLWVLHRINKGIEA